MRPNCFACLAARRRRRERTSGWGSRTGAGSSAAPSGSSATARPSRRPATVRQCRGLVWGGWKRRAVHQLADPRKGQCAPIPCLNTPRQRWLPHDGYLSTGRQDIVKDKSKTAFVRNVPYRCALSTSPAQRHGQAVEACLKMPLTKLYSLLFSRTCPCTSCLTSGDAPAPSCCAAHRSATEDDIVEFFSQAGHVVDVVRRLNQEGAWPPGRCVRTWQNWTHMPAVPL